MPQKITIEELIAENKSSTNIKPKRKNDGIARGLQKAEDWQQFLTEPELIFAHEYVRTRNAAASHRTAYPNDTQSAAHSIRKLKYPRIIEAIKRIAQEVEEQTCQSLKEYVLDVGILFQDCMENGKHAEAVQCKKIIGMALGHLKPGNGITIAHHQTFNIDKALLDLKNRLQEDKRTITLEASAN